MADFNFSCQKCPRTFKLQEFYEKHQKVHLLKKQHVCTVCGFVYGAAKGLEGHIESAHSAPQPTDMTRQERLPLTPDHTHSPPPEKQKPYGMDFHFLHSQGVLGSAEVQNRIQQESVALLQKAQQAMMAKMSLSSTTPTTHSTISFPPLSMALSGPSSPSGSSSVASTSPKSHREREDKSKIPSPAGTGNYKIYDQVPEIIDAGDAQQNDSGFFRCTICTREFSDSIVLKEHVPIHTRRVQHKCDTCGYVFGKKEYLLDHTRKHTGEVSPVCDVCSQTFNKSLKLKEHMKLHRNTSGDGSINEYVPYRCHVCKQCYSQPEPLGDHLRSQHSETVYKCDICVATFGDVRGKNHHMYNEHQLDAFHQKCVWCPVCNQGFTRHYNLKVHMYKSHGKEYLENNFTAEELDALMKPPPGSNTNKPAPSPRKLPDNEIIIPGSNTGSFPISPPLTPKMSPKQRNNNEDSPTMVPSNSVIPSASILKANLEPRSRPGPASLTKPKHYFDQESEHAMMACHICEDKFLRKSDLYIHLGQHGVTIINCPSCEDKFMEVAELRLHMKRAHGQVVRQLEVDEAEPPQQQVAYRKPGPASRTNAPRENRACPAAPTSNLPSYLASQYDDERNGFPCDQCGKVLMHKQSYVSHMRVIHGDYYGGNKWKGSSVVDMILGQKVGGKRSMEGNQEEMATQLSLALNNITNLRGGRVESPNGYAYHCEFCSKGFPDKASLGDHIHSKHPNLTKRIEAFKEALGLNDNDQPDTKRIKLDYQESHKKQTDELCNNQAEQEDQEQVEVKPERCPSPPQQQQVQQEEEPLALVRERRSPSPEPEESHEEEDEVEEPLAVDEDDVRYEPISEEFVFESEVITPCYVVLPFVTDQEVENVTRRNIAQEYYENPDEYTDIEDEGEMVIDENPPSSDEERPSPKLSPSPVQLKVNSFGQGFAGEQNIWTKKPEVYTAQDIKPPTQPIFYPAFPDFSLPFSLSGLIQKKKAEMAAILAPRGISMNPEEGTKLSLDSFTKSMVTNTNKSMSPIKSDAANNNSAVSDYENQIQNDMWPLDCIKCTSHLGNLDNFNIHMNDHWSDDKCCPVCGLLINSKRFNFKQHLKIHTGEKPFVCHVCSRAFRQKAHMVKHVTTHRSEPRSDTIALNGRHPELPNGSLDLSFPNGVIVQ